MTAPRWIADALDASWSEGRAFSEIADQLAAALIERLPIDAMTGAIRKRIAGTAGITGDWIGAVAGLAVAGAVSELAEGDPEVVQLTELYQAVSKALDDAGVPYGTDTAALLDTAARVRWLAQQRPTRLELSRVEAERDSKAGQLDELSKMFTKLSGQRDALAAVSDAVALQFDAADMDRTLPLAEQAGVLRERLKVHVDELNAAHRTITELRAERDSLVALDRQAESLAEQRLLSTNDLRAQLAKANELNGKLAAGGAELQAERDRWRVRGGELYDENEQLREEARDALAQRDAARLQSAEYLGQRDRARADIEERDGTIAALRQQSTKQAGQINDLSTRKVSKPRGKKAVRRVKRRHGPDLWLSPTVEIEHGRPIVELRPDNGTDDPWNLTPREARSLARKLVIVAGQADRKRDARTRLRGKR